MSEAVAIDNLEQLTAIKQLFIFEHQSDGSYKKADVDLNKKRKLHEFLLKTCQLAFSSKSTQEHAFNSDSIVASYIDGLLDAVDDPSDIAIEIASQLSDSENQRVKAGTFILARITNANQDSYLLSKLDFENYFSKSTFELKEGLPEEKGILKSCLINIENNKRKKVIFLSDKNGIIAQFWYEKFLQSSAINQDSENTQKAYMVITDSIRKTLSKISIPDSNELIESTNTYFSTNKSFDFDDFLEKNVKSFKPSSKDVDIMQVASNIIKAKDKKKFDGKFKIIVSDVRKKFKRKIKLDEGMELITCGSVKNKIFKVKRNSKYYLVIDTKQGLSDFEEREF